tara:strand:+ start:2526 stop:3179 length:654 start_codon:yes stop_codon:yes gene_type:complete
MNITYIEKNIYNIYLKTTRSQQNKPWRPRENFDKLSPVDEEYLKKISSILKDRNINAELYFNAPYELWEDKQFYPLEYFTKFKAIKAYNLWVEKMFYEDPDSDVVVNMVKEGFHYIFNKCKENNLKSIESYFSLKTYYPDFLIALSEKTITYYNILALSNYDKVLKQIPKEDVDFIISGFYNNISTLRVRYYRTKKLKTLNTKIINKLNKILNYGRI